MRGVEGKYLLEPWACKQNRDTDLTSFLVQDSRFSLRLEVSLVKQLFIKVIAKRLVSSAAKRAHCTITFPTVECV